MQRCIEVRASRALTVNWIDQVMRHERFSDDESDSYPQIGYQHFIDSSRAYLALGSGISLAVPL